MKQENDGGRGREKECKECLLSPPPRPIFSFDLGYAFSRLYPLLYGAQETKTPKNLPATKAILILDIRTKTSKFYIWRVARSHARAASERRCGKERESWSVIHVFAHPITGGKAVWGGGGGRVGPRRPLQGGVKRRMTFQSKILFLLPSLLSSLASNGELASRLNKTYLG